MSIKNSIFSVVVAGLLVGCSSTERMGNSNLSKKEVARLRVVQSYGSGVGERSSRIVTVDGQEVKPPAKFIEIEPGEHTVSFNFQQITDLGGRFSFTMNVFGNESEVVEPRQTSAIQSVRPVEVNGIFVAGKLHFLDLSSISFQPVPLSELEKQKKAIMGDHYQQHYYITGTPTIRHK